MSEYADEKTLEPTPHRRQQARREGHVARSQDLASALMLLAGLLALATFGGGLAAFLVSYSRAQLGGEAWLAADRDFVVHQWNATLAVLGARLLPIFGLILLAGLAVNVVQIGFLFLPQKLAIDLGRLNPANGWRRIASGAAAVHAGLGAAKLFAALAVAAAVLYNERESLACLTNLAPPALAAQLAQLVLWTAAKIGAALLALALFDYAYQRWRFEQDLKMTPRELREEMRNLEGDPQIAARRKQMRHDLTASVPAAAKIETQADALRQ